MNLNFNCNLIFLQKIKADDCDLEMLVLCFKRLGGDNHIPMELALASLGIF